eukprot:CAMPEP_0196772390 /NCGR_PEP_ID=MMETSP1104-20130614/2206_1 /TAXON_ID=33652 /ORGANISM="Cafeteria sp., Strain Caron Lab Isolate" /LENGTH=346 /DNA_ID=CAMNT_0042142525 /DNA_START=80 /DNA_END=1120 /DNA_ORIENTATION=+
MHLYRSSIPYYLAHVVPLVCALELYFALPFATVAFVFGIIPLLDLMLGNDVANPTPEEEKEMEKSLYFKAPLYLWLPCQVGGQAAAAYAACTLPLTSMQLAGLVVGVGIVGGLGINVAHELVHKLDPVDRFLGKLLLTSVFYGHFAVEHVYGHHKRVATPDDPATSRFGESFYAFYPRTVIGSFRSAWEGEVARLRRTGGSAAQNRVAGFLAASLLHAAAFYAWLGTGGLLFFLGQAWVGFSLLELVNYIEHYGLRRKQLADGRYEPVNPTHSWNAPQKVTNFFLFKLQRHSDHHANALREYQILRSFPESPHLPTGYAGMCVLAVVPPLWRWVMDHRVLAYYKST